MNNKIEKFVLDQFLDQLPNDAQYNLQNMFPGYKVQIIESDMFVTADYKTERIRIYLNKDYKISSILQG